MGFIALPIGVRTLEALLCFSTTTSYLADFRSYVCLEAMTGQDLFIHTTLQNVLGRPLKKGRQFSSAFRPASLKN